MAGVLAGAFWPAKMGYPLSPRGLTRRSMPDVGTQWCLANLRVLPAAWIAGSSRKTTRGKYAPDGIISGFGSAPLRRDHKWRSSRHHFATAIRCRHLRDQRDFRRHRRLRQVGPVQGLIVEAARDGRLDDVEIWRD